MLLLRLRKENNFHIIFPFKTFALWSTEGFKMLLKFYTNISLWRLTFSEQTVHMIWSGVCFSFHHYTSWARRQLQHRWGNHEWIAVSRANLPYRSGKYNTSVKGNFILIAAIHLLRPSAILLVHTCKIFILNASGWVIYSEI